MSDLISDRHQMVRAGYKKLGDAKCKGCGAAIEWWQTNNGKKTPFNPIAADNVQTVPHWATCPKREMFRKGPASGTQPNSPAPPPALLPTLHVERTPQGRAVAANQLLDATDALAVIALYAEGPVLAWANGLTGDELRSETITAANLLRQSVDARASQQSKKRTA